MNLLYTMGAMIMFLCVGWTLYDYGKHEVEYGWSRHKTWAGPVGKMLLFLGGFLVIFHVVLLVVAFT